MTATLRLAHTVLQTNRKAEMREWYTRALGAQVVYETEQIAFLTFDEEHHRLGLIGAPIPFEERTPTTVGLAHTAYTFATLDALLDRFAGLRDAGIRPHVCVAHGPTTSMYYRDPDGNTVELQIDNFATAQETTDYLTGAEFTADPVGPAFDPDRLLAAYESGTAIAELTTRAWASAGPVHTHPLLALTGDEPARPVCAG
ncbi:VOC family protein [Embleya scabrispora]|uniref:VOC family protein n=1 Tax=Embleya scabrispora TaxID=159449 RepID=UPI00035DB6C0|nr:VOC family protein [Embleya scabrispora]MYS82726.1 biphenyl 2,3-dioxygenase [Streptomyces sp. SID5474]